MKYVHVASGAEKEAAEGELHYPWLPVSTSHEDEHLGRAKAAARAEVLEHLKAAAAKSREEPAPKPARRKRKAEASDA